MSRLFHVTSSLNRESIQAHGLDWRRMGAARGIAGSSAPEQAGCFLCLNEFENGMVRQDHQQPPAARLMSGRSTASTRRISWSPRKGTPTCSGRSPRTSSRFGAAVVGRPTARDCHWARHNWFSCCICGLVPTG